ncbi:MAG: hypothetical protein M1820_008123 [Bogoriella megaspora]|nr:MAG: hypothetical protein M1820_008123 [Bogoriella megaspora]
MAEKSRDEAARKRILDHMNADHADSLVADHLGKLSRYVEHYKGLSLWSARTARATDIDLNQLTIDANGQSHQILFDLPMTSLRESRERLVEMDKASLQGLNRSEITITEYKPPQGWHWIVFSAVTLTLMAYYKRSNFIPGSWLYENLLRSVPGFAKFSWTIQPLVFYGIIVIHSCEAFFMANGLLKKHSVPVGSSLWLKWVATTWIDGFCSFSRFKDLARQKTLEREKQKH